MTGQREGWLRVDVGAAALAACLIAVIVVGSPHIETGRMTPWGYVFGLAGASSLVVVRRWPLIPAVVAPAAIFGYLATGHPGGPVLLVGPVTMLVVGYRGTRGVAVVAAAAMSAAVLLGDLIGTGTVGAIGTAGPAWAVALVLIGQMAALRRERTAERERRRTVENEQAVTMERLRIAQDLHDSVAHGLASINVQTNVAERMLTRDTERAKDAIDAIRVASATALDELGAMLSSLRDAGPAAMTPATRIEAIPELVDRARLDGLRITYRRRESDDPVPTAISAAAFRVVQESLSNVRKHAGSGSHVDVRVYADDHDVVGVAVVDDGPVVARRGRGRADGTGLGIVGMRERVAATRGEITVGPRADGHPGFRVHAHWRRADLGAGSPTIDNRERTT